MTDPDLQAGIDASIKSQMEDAQIQVALAASIVTSHTTPASAEIMNPNFFQYEPTPSEKAVILNKTVSMPGAADMARFFLYISKPESGPMENIPFPFPYGKEMYQQIIARKSWYERHKFMWYYPNTIYREIGRSPAIVYPFYERQVKNVLDEVQNFGPLSALESNLIRLIIDRKLLLDPNSLNVARDIARNGAFSDVTRVELSKVIPARFNFPILELCKDVALFIVTFSFERLRDEYKKKLVLPSLLQFVFAVYLGFPSRMIHEDRFMIMHMLFSKVFEYQAVQAQERRRHRTYHNDFVHTRRVLIL